MGMHDRVALYKEIEKHRERPLIVYVTSKRDGADAAMASDALPYLIEQLEALGKNTNRLDFLIVSFGGDPMVAWRIMSLIRERVKEVSVLIPQSAYSAATLVALGGDEIIMHPNGHLGPVDMQITTAQRKFSTEDISAFVGFVREDLSITDQEHLRRLFEITCSEVGSLGVGFTARSQRLAVALAQKLLSMPSEDESATNRTIVENLSRQFHSHAYPVSRKEAAAIGLPINTSGDSLLEDLMWKVWRNLEDELQERIPFHPLSELLNSPVAGDLLKPNPETSKQVDPVDFEIVSAIMESCRLGQRSVTRGKILASRELDLNIQFNTLVTYSGWEVTHCEVESDAT